MAAWEDREFVDNYARDLAKNTLSEGEVVNDKAINVSLENIIMTIRGERIFHPYFGGNLPLVLFESLNVDDAEELLETLLEAIREWEPRITMLKDKIEMTIKRNENAMILVLPYIINENGIQSYFSKKIIM